VRVSRSLILASLSLAGCGLPLFTPRPVLPDAPAPAGPAAYAVYSIVLDRLAGRPLMIAVHAGVIPDTLVRSTAPRKYRDIVPPRDSNWGSIRIANLFTTHVPVYVLPWPMRNCPYPGADGAYSLSRVSFNSDSTHAFVRVVLCCTGDVDQSTDFYLLRKPGHAWAIAPALPPGWF
jgi:hypothetical protein